MGIKPKVFCNVKRHTSVAGGMEVPKKSATLFVAKQGGTADSKIIRPWQRRPLSGVFVYLEVAL